MDTRTYEKHELYRDMQAVLKFYCLRGNTPTKTTEKMKSVHGNNCMN